MNINLEDYLHKIDLAFKDKEQKEIYMIYIMIFSAIFAFSYMFFWDSSEGDFNKRVSDIRSINSKIDADKRFLQYNPEIKIAKLQNEIKKAQKELDTNKDINQYIKSKIETISSLIYDERVWGEYLYTISSNARKYNVKINNFINKYEFNQSSFGHVMDINLNITGNYKNTLKFINSLEKSELVVDIHDLDIKAQDRLNTDLNISVWGIIY
jgi:Tfp pilus assembly protein PilO